MKAVPTRPQAPTYTRQPLDCIFGEPRMTHDQIAAELDISRQGVHATFTRINKRLRRALADLNPNQPSPHPRTGTAAPGPRGTAARSASPASP